jgi:zinc transport system substrate-binding protein
MVLMFGRRPAAAMVALAVTAIALTGCQRRDDGHLQVVTSFYPLQFVAQRVVGATPDVDITNLTRPGQEPHDLELTVEQTAKVVDADVLLVERGLQPAVDDAVDTSEPPRVLDAADVVHLRPQAGHPDQRDPHFWLDPTLLSRVAAAFEKELAGSDPSHAATYRRNLQTLQRQLGGLDRAFTRGLAHCRVDTIVVSHDAFG